MREFLSWSHGFVVGAFIGSTFLCPHPDEPIATDTQYGPWADQYRIEVENESNDR